MHQRDSSQLAQLLVELGVAMMGERLANKNVQLRLHRQDSSVEAKKKRTLFATYKSLSGSKYPIMRVLGQTAVHWGISLLPS